MATQIQPREQQAAQLVKSFMPQLKTLLQNDKSKVSAYATTLKQLALNPNLKDVDVESVLKTAFEIVQAGLNPNPLFGQAYVVPFKTKYGTKAQLQIGYKGWISLGYRNGWKFRAVAVYDVDYFNMKFAGLHDIIEFEPDYENRNEEDGTWVYKHLQGVIVYAQDKEGNEFSEFVPFKKLEKLRLKSQNQKEGQLQYIWLEWAEEMYKAKALKYVITRLPIQEQIMDMAVKEDEVFKEPPIDVEAVETKQNDSPLDKKIELPKQKEPIEAKPQEPDYKKELVKKLIDKKIARSKALKLADGIENPQEYLQDEGKFQELILSVEAEEAI
ncbi:recombination protein RecT [Nitratiruptor phage NrS-5]|uniref:recombinase RecT n=1 Tax=unclassified Nitratiruptor TaxID=2624044 RepID=UPI001915FEF0|nr:MULTISPECIES: recombinase RecT [unclassified Nitratiruptor]BCD61718.1 recombination protein RecT [Nitratiruptor sp. YY08-13]BCD65653.1 recombination protein RecT [Nitratiruptor sp. YY08-26]BCD83196.1 recombination protein RecT [Nitratiruptor phage NrS-4]BCD83255.1 recombination protein RecT [Nitratiruptor phage NrS-5]